MSSINPSRFARLLTRAQDLESKKTGQLPTMADLFLKILGEGAAEQLILLIGEQLSIDPIEFAPKLFKTDLMYVLEVLSAVPDEPAMVERVKYEISLDGSWRGDTRAAREINLTEAETILRISDHKSAIEQAKTDTVRRVRSEGQLS